MSDYVVLSNGKLNWSVQCANAIFYKQMSQTESIKQYKTALIYKNDEIEKYKYERDAFKLQLDEKIKENTIMLKHNKMMANDLAKRDKQIAKLEETIKKLKKK